MDKTEYVVYWTDHNGMAHATPTSVMGDALKITKRMRDAGMTFVVMASELASNVGKMGVAAVVDGKCPDGGDFLGRTARHGMALKRAHKESDMGDPE